MSTGAGMQIEESSNTLVGVIETRQDEKAEDKKYED